jgi:hypothetical protein
MSHILHQLPQRTRAFINGINHNYNLVTFWGAANLRTLTSHQGKMTLLDPVQQNAQVLLPASDFNLWSAKTDSNDISIEIDQKLLKLACHQICASFFAEICNGYTKEPQATLDHIKQVYVDGDRNQVCVAYYQRMMSAMRPFAGNKMFLKSVCNPLVDGMSTHLQLIFCKYYPNHAMLHNLSATFQCNHFHQILIAM